MTTVRELFSTIRNLAGDGGVSGMYSDEVLWPHYQITSDYIGTVLAKYNISCGFSGLIFNVPANATLVTINPMFDGNLRSISSIQSTTYTWRSKVARIDIDNDSGQPNITTVDSLPGAITVAPSTSFTLYINQVPGIQALCGELNCTLLDTNSFTIPGLDLRGFSNDDFQTDATVLTQTYVYYVGATPNWTPIRFNVGYGGGSNLASAYPGVTATSSFPFLTTVPTFQDVFSQGQLQANNVSISNGMLRVAPSTSNRLFIINGEYQMSTPKNINGGVPSRLALVLAKGTLGSVNAAIEDGAIGINVATQEAFGPGYRNGLIGGILLDVVNTCVLEMQSSSLVRDFRRNYFPMDMWIPYLIT